MSTGKVLYDLLSSDATISGLVGTKIFPVKVPQDTKMPAIVYQHDSIRPTDIKDGPSPLDEVDITIVVYSLNYEQGYTIASRIRAILDFYSGTNSGIVVERIRYRGGADNDFVDDYGFYIQEQNYKARVKR